MTESILYANKIFCKELSCSSLVMTLTFLCHHFISLLIVYKIMQTNTHYIFILVVILQTSSCYNSHISKKKKKKKKKKVEKEDNSVTTQ